MNSSVKFDLKKYSTLLALLVLFVVLAFSTKGDFLLARNFTNLSLQISINAILAVGMTFVILTGGIDLSVGSVVALSGVVAGIAQVHWNYTDMGAWGTVLSAFYALLVGLCCGTINGFLIAFFRIPPFVISLGMMVIAAGAALIFSDSSAISPMSDSFKIIAKGLLSPQISAVFFLVILIFWGKTIVNRFRQIGAQWTFFLQTLLELLCILYPAYAYLTDRGIPYPVLILAIVAFSGQFILNRLPLGRFIYAIGGNEEAASLSGIAVRPIKLFVYGLMGLIAGISGVVLTARLNSAAPTAGALMELDAIAAVVIGGTSLMGGLGTISGSIIGATFIGTVNNGMDLLGIDSNYQMVIKGLIIVVAVWSDSRNKKHGI